MAELDWGRAKKVTLWTYEELLGKLQTVMNYPLVREHYDHDMHQAIQYTCDIRRGYLWNEGSRLAYVDEMSHHLARLGQLGVGRYSDLLKRVGTRDSCRVFLATTHFEFETLLQVLDYLMRWVLPFEAPLRQFIDPEDQGELKLLAALKAERITTNLALLEAGRRPEGRAKLVKATQGGARRVTAWVHRADISRLAWVRGRTVRHLCGAGYDTLDKLAQADLDKMEQKMAAYYATLGKTLRDFAAVIPLRWMIGGARTVPKVVEE
jgi:hypothetical protein